MCRDSESRESNIRCLRSCRSAMSGLDMKGACGNRKFNNCRFIRKNNFGDCHLQIFALELFHSFSGSNNSAFKVYITSAVKCLQRVKKND